MVVIEATTTPTRPRIKRKVRTSAIAGKAHEQTQTSQEVAKVERRLVRGLNVVYNQTKAALKSVPNLSWVIVRQTYGQTVDDEIKAALTDIYIAASKYVTDSADLTFFLTEQDLAKIKEQSAYFINWFWSALERELVKKTMTAYDPRTLLMVVKNPPEFTSTFITRLAASMASWALSESTIHKTRQIAPRLQSQKNSLFMSAAARTVTKRKADLGGSESQPTRLVWKCALDDKTCPICEPLEGDIYEFDNPAIPTPVEDTHPNCRCRLLLLDNNDDIVMD